MGSILDSLGSLWNDLEQAGSVVFHSMEDAINHLGQLGVPAFSSLGPFISFLVSMGENPFTFLPQVVNVINSRGGNPVQVLEELAWGFMTEGPVPYTQKQLAKRINPVLDGLNEHTQTSNTVALLHQDTISQVQHKLTALRQGNGSLGFQGDFALALDTHFTGIQTNVTQLTAPLGTSLNTSTDSAWSDFEGRVNQANQELATALENVSPWAVAGFVLLDLAIIVVFCVVDVGAGLATIGIADVPLVPLEGIAFSAIILAELQILGLWVPLMRWLFEILAAVDVLVREEVQAQATATTTTSPTPGPTPGPTPTPKPGWWPWPDPIPPDLWDRPPSDRDDCLRKISQVKAKFPNVRADLIHYLVCLEPALTPQQVIDLFAYWTAHGMTEQDINNFLDRMMHLRIRGNQLSRAQILAFLTLRYQDIPDIWSQYQRVSTIPNVDQILRDMANGNPGDYKGSRYQLDWLANHSNQVRVVEPPGPNGQKGPDFILNNGTIVDLKAGFRGNATKLGAEIAEQIMRYRTLYPGHPILYVFNSAAGAVPSNVSNMLGATSITDISDGIAKNYMADTLKKPLRSITPAEILLGKQQILAAIQSPGPVSWNSWP